MGIIELIILAIGLAMDAFAVSVCKGLALKKITIKSVLICGIWFGGFQALMPVIGYFAGVSFSKYIVKFDHWIAKLCGSVAFCTSLDIFSCKDYGIFFVFPKDYDFVRKRVFMEFAVVVDN